MKKKHYCARTRHETNCDKDCDSCSVCITPIIEIDDFDTDQMNLGFKNKCRDRNYDEVVRIAFYKSHVVLRSKAEALRVMKAAQKEIEAILKERENV